MLLPNETAEEAFHRLMSSRSSRHHAKVKRALQALSNVKKINEARQADGKEEEVSKEDDEPQLIVEAKTAMNDVLDMNTNSSDKLSLEERVGMLNDDQRRIFENIKTHLYHQQRHEANDCSCEHMAVRRAILQHMIHIAHFIIGHHVVEYMPLFKNILQIRAWTRSMHGVLTLKCLLLANLLQSPIMSYSVQHHSWQRYAPHDVDRTFTDNILQTSMYLVHAYNHFEVACSVRKSM